MYFMKRSTLIIVLVCVVGFLAVMFMVGCSSKDTKSGDSGQPPAEQKLNLRVAGQHPMDHVATEALKRIKERVEKETNGRIELTLYPANQLGDYTLVYEEIMRGSIDIAHIFVPSQYDQRLEISSIPYLVRTYDEMEKVLSPGSYMYDTYAKLHENLGVKLLGIYAEGFIGYGLKKLPDGIYDPTVKKNLLVRVAPLEVYKLAAEDVGFTTTTIPYADLYSALQTGVADGWVGGTPTLNYQSFRDVIKVYLAYNCLIENTSYLMNKKLFDSLSPADQKVIADAFMDESLKSFKLSQAEDELYMKKMKEAGIDVYEFTEEELTVFADHIRTVTWPKLYDRFGKDIMEGILNDLQ